MKNLLFSILAFSFFSITNAQRTEKLGSFNKVTAFDKIDILLIKSNENKAIVKGKNADDVELVIKNGELKVKLPVGKFMKGEDISTTIYFTEINALEANEGSRIATQEAIEAIDFEVICKEGGQVQIKKLDCNKFSCRIYSGSELTIDSGASEFQDILSNSGATYFGKNFVSSSLNVTVNAGGKAQVNASNLVDAKTRAGGHIAIYGNPKRINEKTIAGGTIEEVK